MPKKDFSTAGMDILGLRTKEQAEPENEPFVEVVEEVEPVVFETAPVKNEKKPIGTVKAGEGTEAAPKAQPVIKQAMSQPIGPKLVRKSYYVTPAQHKALRIMAANGETPADKDISAIVRSALEQIIAKYKK